MAKYYNGTILPDLPTDVDRTTYPHAIILINDESTNDYELYFFAQPVCYYSETQTCFPLIGSALRMYMLDTDTNEWYFLIEATVGENASGFPTTAIKWLDHDICDNETNEVYYKAQKVLPFVESSTRTIKVSDEYYKSIADVCRNKFNVETQYKPSELPAVIKGLGSLIEVPFDESLITNGVIYTESGIEFVGDIMTPGCCVDMEFSNITIPSQFTKIADYAFADTKIGSTSDGSYKGSLVLGDNIVSIGKYAFFRAIIDKMYGIDFPETLTTIEDYAFSCCHFWGRIELTLPNTITTLGEGVFSQSYIGSIVIPNSITTIGRSCFYSCDYLTKADISANVDELLSTMFWYCEKLEALILRKTESIYNCGSMVLGSTPIASGTGYIYVPSALIDTYKADSNWSTYAAQFRAIEDYPDICGTS